MAKDTTTNGKYRGYTINNGQDGNLHCHTKTLDQIIDTVEHMTAEHSRVLSVRLDIQNTATGCLWNNGQEIDYALDSKDIKNGYSVKEAVSRAVKKKLQNANNTPNESYDGLVNFSGSNGAKGNLIERNSPEAEDQINDVIFAGSYLAKVRTKEFNPKGSRVSSCTRISRK